MRECTLGRWIRDTHSDPYASLSPFTTAWPAFVFMSQQMTRALHTERCSTCEAWRRRTRRD